MEFPQPSMAQQQGKGTYDSGVEPATGKSIIMRKKMGLWNENKGAYVFGKKACGHTIKNGRRTAEGTYKNNIKEKLDRRPRH